MALTTVLRAVHCVGLAVNEQQAAAHPSIVPRRLRFRSCQAVNDLEQKQTCVNDNFAARSTQLFKKIGVKGRPGDALSDTLSDA